MTWVNDEANLERYLRDSRLCGITGGLRVAMTVIANVADAKQLVASAPGPTID
jgi:hypothetical protein